MSKKEPKCEKNGWLHKQGEQRKSWKKRFMKLCGQTLYYYPGPKVSSQPKYVQIPSFIFSTYFAHSIFVPHPFTHSPFVSSQPRVAPKNTIVRDTTQLSRIQTRKDHFHWLDTTSDRQHVLGKIFVLKYVIQHNERITCTRNHRKSKNRGNPTCCVRRCRCSGVGSGLLNSRDVDDEGGHLWGKRRQRQNWRPVCKICLD